MSGDCQNIFADMNITVVLPLQHEVVIANTGDKYLGIGITHPETIELVQQVIDLADRLVSETVHDIDAPLAHLYQEIPATYEHVLQHLLGIDQAQVDRYVKGFNLAVDQTGGDIAAVITIDMDGVEHPGLAFHVLHQFGVADRLASLGRSHFLNGEPLVGLVKPDRQGGKLRHRAIALDRLHVLPKDFAGSRQPPDIIGEGQDLIEFRPFFLLHLDRGFDFLSIDDGGLAGQVDETILIGTAIEIEQEGVEVRIANWR